jgi:hypothetical protein
MVREWGEVGESHLQGRQSDFLQALLTRREVDPLQMKSSCSIWLCLLLSFAVTATAADQETLDRKLGDLIPDPTLENRLKA